MMRGSRLQHKLKGDDEGIAQRNEETLSIDGAECEMIASNKHIFSHDKSRVEMSPEKVTRVAISSFSQ